MSEAWGARLEGKLDLLNERHDRVIEDVKAMRERQHSHSNRLQLIEANHHSQMGERKGQEQVVRMLWAVISLIGGGGVLTIVTLVLKGGI